MIRSRLSRLYAKTDVRAAIGWLIFIGLMVAMLNDRYIFNPFIFGFGYYVLYVFSKMGDAGTELRKHRTIAIGVIALLYLWIALNSEHDRDKFLKSFEATCSETGYQWNEAKSQVCEQIQSDITETLSKDADFDSDPIEH